MKFGIYLFGGNLQDTGACPRRTRGTVAGGCHAASLHARTRLLSDAA